MEFTIGWFFKTSPFFDNEDFYYFMWQYDRIIKQKEQSKNGIGTENLLDNMDLLSKMRG